MIRVISEVQDNGFVKVECEQKDISLPEVLGVITEMLNKFDTVEEKIAACSTAFTFSLNQKSYQKEEGCFIDQNLIDIMKNFKGEEDGGLQTSADVVLD